MEAISQIFSFISGLGKYVMIPLMVSLIGIAFKCNPNKAIKGGVTVGIGLFGLDLALSLVSKYLGPVATALVDQAHLSLDVIDVGWTALSGIAYATEIGALIIPFCLMVNIIMLSLGATKTMDIDIWNFWHYALTGSLIYLVSKNILLGFLAAAAHFVILLTIADRTAKQTQDTIGVPGVSIPHGGALGGWVIGYVMEKVYNFFSSKFSKGENKEKKIDAEKAKKLQKNPLAVVFRDPVYVGFILGVVLALIGKQDVKTALVTGMAMAALLYLTPRMVKILMEGLLPISNACKAIMAKKYKGQELYIGMDNAIILGHPAVMIGTVVMIPVCVLLAIFLPGNRIVPLASLAACGYNCTVLCVMHKGKTWRTLLSCTILLSVLMLIGSSMAEEITSVAVATGYGWSQTDYTLISAISGTLASTFWFFHAFELNTFVGIALCLVIIVGLIIWNRAYFKKQIDLSTTEFKDADASSYTKE